MCWGINSRQGFYSFIDKCNLSLRLWDFSNIATVFHYHHSDRWRHHLVACLVLWKLVSLDVKWHFLLFLLRILPYFGGRTGKRGKCPYAPSILSGRNGHILRKPSVPYHCLPRNQEFHTFYLNLADIVKHTLKGALEDKFHYFSFAKDIWQNYIFFFLIQ